MKVLVACEESQTVCKAFRAKGHEAYSCDILPCSGGHPEWHIQGDVIPLLNPDWWDLVIAFPPCTDLAVSGARHFKRKREDGTQQKSIEFFMQFANYNGMIAIENPIGIMSRIWRKPDQIIQPYYFGDPYPKKTCLWLNGLPLLIATNMVEPEYVIYKSKKTKSGVSKYSFMGNMPTSGSNEKARSIRSKTASGIADAMADQWLNL